MDTRARRRTWRHHRGHNEQARGILLAACAASPGSTDPAIRDAQSGARMSRDLPAGDHEPRRDPSGRYGGRDDVAAGAREQQTRRRCREARVYPHRDRRTREKRGGWRAPDGVEVVYRHVDTESLPFTEINDWSGKAWASLHFYFNQVNGVPMDEITEGTQGAQTVGAFAPPRPTARPGKRRYREVKREAVARVLACGLARVRGRLRRLHRLDAR